MSHVSRGPEWWLNSLRIIHNTKLMQEDFHGTMCAGIVATTCNKIGGNRSISRGILKIMPIKILNSRNDDNVGSVNNLIKAIKYAENNGASICNISLNTDKDSDELRSVIKQSNMFL